MQKNLQNNIFTGMDINLPDEIYIGRGLFYQVKGWAYHPGYRIKKIELTIGNARFPMDEINYPRIDVYNALHQKGAVPIYEKQTLRSGFSGCFCLKPQLKGTSATIQIVATLEDGSKQTIYRKTTYFKKDREYFSPIKIKNNYDKKQPLIAICMATYSPDIKAFQKQIESIKNQSYPYWICIISDDGSDEPKASAIKKAVADDQRFYLLRNKKNLGYYRNFERSLCHVPDEAQFVAFSDQDDFWYPYKLDNLLKRLSKEKQLNLVYSDMRIVDGNGNVISKTYWRKRKNHYKDLGMVMVCGTVTGAASLFRKKLLNTALPFPQDTGNAFHDHVISCAALAAGKIGYIDEPLYDYIQHDVNVIGHHEFETTNLANLIIEDIKNFSELHQRILSLQENYEINYIRLRLIAGSLSLRIHKPVAWLKTFNNEFISIIRLFFLYLKVQINRNTTENAEVVVALSIIARRIYQFLHCKKR